MNESHFPVELPDRLLKANRGSQDPQYQPCPGLPDDAAWRNPNRLNPYISTGTP